MAIKRRIALQKEEEEKKAKELHPKRYLKKLKVSLIYSLLFLYIKLVLNNKNKLINFFTKEANITYYLADSFLMPLLPVHYLHVYIFQFVETLSCPRICCKERISTPPYLCIRVAAVCLSL